MEIEMDELEPVTDIRIKAALKAAELRDVADTIERNPELLYLDDWFDAAQRMQMDLDAIDGGYAHLGEAGDD